MHIGIPALKKKRSTEHDVCCTFKRAIACLALRSSACGGSSSRRSGGSFCRSRPWRTSDPRIDPPLAALAARPGEAEACAAAGQSLTPPVASPDKPKRAFGTESNLRVAKNWCRKVRKKKTNQNADDHVNRRRRRPRHRHHILLLHNYH